MHVCIANIGPRGRRRRLLWGIAGFATALALAIAFAALNVSSAVRALVFFPIAWGAYGFLQYREKT